MIGIADIPADAFGLVVEHKPDVVVMDIRLKNGADGLHAADAMRTLYKTPIVFCTGYGDPDTIWRIRRFGRTECLFKPVRPQELRDAILRAFSPSARVRCSDRGATWNASCRHPSIRARPTGGRIRV